MRHNQMSQNLTMILVHLIKDLFMKKSYTLTSSSKVLPQKLIGPQPVQKFSALNGPRMFITPFTSSHQLSLFSAKTINFVPPYTTFRRCILILSSHLRLGIPSGLFPSGLIPNSRTHLFRPPYTTHASAISFFLNKS
jgi:hypothetical protein